MDSTRNSPPVAVRIVRPYPNEDALLEAESSAFTRTGVVLIGAPSRPSGVVLRFEMCLQDGTPVMRGEGRVVGYRPPSSGPEGSEEGALMLRFTRLDIKSKSLLDRAVAMREERRSLAPAARPPAPPPAPAPLHQPSSIPPSAGPSTDREIEAAAPIEQTAVAEPEAMDVDDLDLRSADESDLTVQAPPVEAAHASDPKTPEKAPIPKPSPGGVPVPHPIGPEPTPHRRAPEHAPMPQIAPEHAPMPQPSPEPKRRASSELESASSSREEFRPTLEPAQRDSALDRLRGRARRSQP